MLYGFVDSAKHRPFAWGQNDCCLFAADCVLAICGVDIADEYRGKYSTALGAFRAVKKYGGLEAAIERACASAEFPQVSVDFARRGDLVLFDTEHGPALGICLGVDSWLAGENGLVCVHTNQCRKAWRVD